MARSAARAAEIKAMDGIERAMARIDDLPADSAARVRRWHQEVYGTSEATATFPSGTMGATPQGGQAARAEQP